MVSSRDNSEKNLRNVAVGRPFREACGSTAGPKPSPLVGVNREISSLVGTILATSPARESISDRDMGSRSKNDGKFCLHSEQDGGHSARRTPVGSQENQPQRRQSFGRWSVRGFASGPEACRAVRRTLTLIVNRPCQSSVSSTSVSSMSAADPRRRRPLTAVCEMSSRSASVSSVASRGSS